MDCKRCRAILVNPPEYVKGDWIIRCVDCGAKKFVIAGLGIVGWKK